MVALVLAALLAAPLPAPASDLISVPLVSAAPVMDGSLHDPLWQKAATATVAYDVTLHETAQQPTIAYVMTDGRFLYVAFNVKTTAPIHAQERTNGVGLDTDDEVQIDLWPGGDQGFQYKFNSTPIGTHYQYSTENNSFEPNWLSAGKIENGGFTVNMKIPLNVMRGSARIWRVQFIRIAPAQHQFLVWHGGTAQGDFNDVTFAGRLSGIPRVAALRPRPRIGVYALGALASHAIGGSTSRMGMDLSIPLDYTTSFVATLHPDYSNVEKDQQTISPTAFRRFFSEVRPFFTQLGNFYNSFSCISDCPQDLYTPAIPTPRDGYALEGKEGQLSFAAFDALGFSRDDQAQSVYYKTRNRHWQLTTQRVAVGMPGFRDVTTSEGLTFNNHVNLFGYYNFGVDTGTNVGSNIDNKRSDLGFGFNPPNTFIGGSIRRIGSYYNPFDGIVTHSGVAGYNFYADHQRNYARGSSLQWFNISGFIDRYHGKGVGLNQTTNQIGVELLTRKLTDVYFSSGSQYLRFGNGAFSPVTVNAISLTWNATTSAPTLLGYNFGRFGPGRLSAWSRSSTLRLGRRGSLTLVANDTVQRLDNGQTLTQWLERLGYAYQSGPNESLAIGVRRIIGTPPMLGSLPSFTNAWNVSFAYHKLFLHDELYIVYGDASALSTSPQAIVKLVHYFGADKGT